MDYKKKQKLIANVSFDRYDHRGKSIDFIKASVDELRDIITNPISEDPESNYISMGDIVEIESQKYEVVDFLLLAKPELSNDDIPKLNYDESHDLNHKSSNVEITVYLKAL